MIDFASFSRSGPVYTDVAHFLAYLSLLARKPLYSRKTVESVARQFLCGYSRDLNSSILRLYVARAVLRITVDGNPQTVSGFVEATLDLLSTILDNKLTGPITE